MSARERILDAATEVMRSKGYAAATTREIARVAACSEALLYKNFPDKQGIFAAVLAERMPELADPLDLVGRDTVPRNLATLVSGLIDFYVQSLPIATSILGTPSLREAERASAERRGGGIDVPARSVERYLHAEVDAGRIPGDVDVTVAARTLTGAALFEAFRAVFADESHLTAPRAVAERIVASTTVGSLSG